MKKNCNNWRGKLGIKWSMFSTFIVTMIAAITGIKYSQLLLFEAPKCDMYQSRVYLYAFLSATSTGSGRWDAKTYLAPKWVSHWRFSGFSLGNEGVVRFREFIVDFLWSFWKFDKNFQNIFGSMKILFLFLIFIFFFISFHILYFMIHFSFFTFLFSLFNFHFSLFTYFFYHFSHIIFTFHFSLFYFLLAFYFYFFLFHFSLFHFCVSFIIFYQFFFLWTMPLIILLSIFFILFIYI